ncbi:HD domain-containing protein [Actinoplanes siamensis]|nr:HD domain-containing protein [Actinoplanes siamensis]
MTTHPATPPPSDVLTLPDNELATATLALVADAESIEVANHSVRSYLFARLLAEHQQAVAGRDYQPQLLFVACVLHDVGLSALGDRRQRFEIDGADVAAEFLTARGLPTADVDAVWDAIALHTSPGIAERRSVLCELVRRGVGVDIGLDAAFVTEADAARIHAAHPRREMTRSLVDTIVAQAHARPEKAPPYSLAWTFLRERGTAPHVTALEAAAAASRWGR